MNKKIHLLKENSFTEKAEKAKANLFDMYISICARINASKKCIEKYELQKQKIMRILEIESD